jgi:hypothetical protein
MRPVLFFLAFISFTTTVNAQNRYTDTSATCIAFWKNQEARIYQVKRTKQKYDEGVLRSSGESYYEAHIKVLDSTETGFKIEWTYKNFRSSIKNEFAIASLNAIMESLKVVYRTDDLGMFTELLNWEEVRDKALSNYQAALTAKAREEEFIVALNQLKAIFQSKENIEAIMIKDVQMLHSPFGVEFTKSGMSLEAQLPNVTGGEPFPATIVLKLDEINERANKAVVSVNQAIDKGKAGPVIAAILMKLSTKPLDDAELVKRIKDMDITDLVQFTYAIDSGWFTRIFYERTSIVADMKLMETYEFMEKK